MNGAQSFLPTFMINFHKVDDEKDYLAYVSRLQKIGVAFDQLLERAHASTTKGIRPPKFAYEGVIEQANKVVAGAPFDAAASADSALWADAQAKRSEERRGGKGGGRTCSSRGAAE